MDALLAALVTVICTNLVLLWQLIIFRRTLHTQTQANLTAKWNAVTALEISDSDLHRLLMNDDALAATATLTSLQLKERAFAHMVFDVFSDQFRARSAGVGVGADAYLVEVLRNPQIRRYWGTYRLRDAWRDDPFQGHVDTLIAGLERRE